MQKRTLNVMQIISNLDIGGAQEVVRTLVEYLASSNCVPIVCTFEDGPLRQEIERLGVKVEVLPPRRYSIIALPLFVADMLQILRALVRLIKKYNIDVVQTHLLRSLDFFVLSLRYTSYLPVVLWTFHNANFELTAEQLPKYKWLLASKNFGYRVLYRLASNLVSGFVAVSDKVAESMVEVIGPIQDKIVVICNGVDVKRYERSVDKGQVRNLLGLESSTRLISVVATLKEQKGHCYLIQAMASIMPRYPDLHVLFVGDGNLREELQAQVKNLALDNHIHFLGNRQDVPELLTASDFFVLPSLWEGLPMALLEAMAASLPLVATNVSGTIQVVTPNKTGLLVPPGDSKQLAQAIEQLISDPTLAQALGIAARRWVENEFNAQAQANQHLTLYHRLLNSKSKVV